MILNELTIFICFKILSSKITLLLYIELLLFIKSR
uniref:Uncharacterized protein n=1 Tax=Siphoviridae sp. ctxMM9 TaxID=2827973 RepID=A0A8S5T6Z3_9CAUD|nr:MAG TPA: hypothetical protein [Siphoviridae sp. ctxMM9]